jgi:hypothetical protein
MSRLAPIFTRNPKQPGLMPRKGSFPGNFKDTILNHFGSGTYSDLYKLVGYLDPSPQQWHLFLFFVGLSPDGDPNGQYFFTTSRTPGAKATIFLNLETCADRKVFLHALLYHTTAKTAFREQTIPLLECTQYHLKWALNLSKVQTL